MITGLALLLEKLIAKLLFLAECGLGLILDLLYEVFEIFAGIEPITYSGKKAYLLDMYFSNDIINALFRAMALIGIAMTFGFAVAAVIKKAYDSTGEKVKATYGMIIGNVLKSILLILLLTAIVSATITSTGVLMRQIDTIFDNAEEIADPSEITFDKYDCAAMFRIIDTIANYSLNTSYNSRYNINTCFNLIRGDMQILEKAGVFRFAYDSTEAEHSWQAALLKIYNAADIYTELPLDKYNDRVTDAITSCVAKIQKDASFKPLSYYYRGYKNITKDSILGRTILLACSFEAANNSIYNESPSITDSLRGQYYRGAKDMYSYDEVSDDFSLLFADWNHVVAIFTLIILILEFLKILVNCVARIFNIILLYITAPGFASVMPLDDGGKMKQWTTAFVIQSLSIFGTVIAVRLMIVFIPITLDSQLQIFDDPVKNMLAKIILIISICETAQKASGMISGILADNAGYQSIMAGDVGSGTVSKGMSFGARTLSVAASAVKTVDGFALKKASDVLGTTTLGKKIGDAFGNKFQAMREKWGVGGWITNAARGNSFNSKARDKEQAEQQEKQIASADRDDSRKFRENVTGTLGQIAESMGAQSGGQKGGQKQDAKPAGQQLKGQPGGQKQDAKPVGQQQKGQPGGQVGGGNVGQVGNGVKGGDDGNGGNNNNVGKIDKVGNGVKVGNDGNGVKGDNVGQVGQAGGGNVGQVGNDDNGGNNNNVGKINKVDNVGQVGNGVKGGGDGNGGNNNNVGKIDKVNNAVNGDNGVKVGPVAPVQKNAAPKQDKPKPPPTKEQLARLFGEVPKDYNKEKK